MRCCARANSASADVPTLRAGFNQVMGRVPVPGDVDQNVTTALGRQMAAAKSVEDDEDRQEQQAEDRIRLDELKPHGGSL